MTGQGQTKRKILFVNDEMEMGGVARVLNTLMNNLDRERYDIDLLVLHKTGALLKEIPADVRVLAGTSFFRTVDCPLKELLKKKNLRLLMNKLRLLVMMKTGLIRRRIVKERRKMLDTTYDVEVAAKEGFCTIFTACGDSRRKVNWVLTDYSVCNYSANHMRLMRSVLEKIDLNIADSHQAAEAYKKVFGVREVITIHNLMNTEKVTRGMRKSEDLDPIDPQKLNVISVIRFHPQKAADRLLIAHEEAMRRGLTHELYLIGGGEQEAMLRQMKKDRQLDHVHFLGYRTNPYADIHVCDLFVLPSLYEGFATVINESLLAQTPVLTTEVAGVHEQILEPCHGWIVANDQQALSEGLCHALSSKAALQQMKQELADYRYPNEQIRQRFMEVL